MVYFECPEHYILNLNNKKAKENIEETGKNNHYEVNISNIVGQTRSGRKSEVEIQRRLGGFIYLRRRLSAFRKGGTFEFDITK